MNHIFGLCTLQNWHILGQNQKQCAIVHLENIVSTESFPAECPHLTLGVRYAYQPEKKKHETGLLPHLATSKSSGSSRGEDKNLEKWCMDIILAQKCPRT